MSRMQLKLENDNKLRYQQWPAYMHNAQLTPETKAIGHGCSCPLTLESPARHSVGGVLFSHNSHTHRTHSYTTTQRDLIHDPLNWKASFDILSSRNELWQAHFTKKWSEKKSLCNKKARLLQIQRKDDLCWTHDTMLLMQECEDNKSSKDWTDTIKASFHGHMQTANPDIKATDV